MIEVENVKNEAPQFSNLTTSRMKQFCHTSSIFEVDNIINEAILQNFLQEWKVECRAGGLVPMRLAIFPIHLSKVLRLPRKSEARLYEVLHLSRTIILANLKISCSKMQPLSGNQRPDLLTEHLSLACLLLCACHGKCIFADPLHMYHACHRFWKCYKRILVLLTFQLPKVLQERGVLYILTWKCALRHNLRFFIISTSNSGLRPSVFYTFDFEMCFAPKRRAPFHHLNFQKWSETVSFFYTFDFEMCFAPKRRALFHHLNFPKVVWDRHFFSSRHDAVQFFISHLARWLRARRFSEPAFDPLNP